MNYISPKRFFEYLDISLTDISDVKQLKKLTKLEFLSAEFGVININGFDYNQYEVLLFLSLDNFNENVNFHQIIWENKALLNVLESNYVDYEKISDIITIFQNNKVFGEFINPYFAKSFNLITKKLLEGRYIKECSIWLKTNICIHENYEEVAYNSLRQYFDSSIYVFRNINQVNYTSRLSKIRIWVHDDWSRVFNNLPNYLNIYREEIAEYLTNLLTLIQLEEKEMCFLISSWLIRLSLSSEVLTETIKDNHFVYKSAYESSFLDAIPLKRKKASFLRPRVILLLSFLCLVLLFAIGLIILKDDGKNNWNYKGYSVPVNTESDNTITNISNSLDQTKNYFSDITYSEIEDLYQKKYNEASLTSDVFNPNKYQHLPIYFTIYKNSETIWAPIKISNLTTQDLSIVYLYYGDVKTKILLKGKSICLEAYENPNIGFFIDSIQSTNLKMPFSMDGTQTISISHGKNYITNITNNSPYAVFDAPPKNETKMAMTIDIGAKENKYQISIIGDSLYFFTAKK